MSVIALLMASLLGSTHCVVMCGGFVALYSARNRGILSHVLYNVGRLTTYLSIGAIAGIVGSQVDQFGALRGVTHLATYIVSVILILWGMTGLTSRSGRSGLQNFVAQRLTPIYSRLLVPGLRPSRLPSVLQSYFIGALTTLLPCGWLYAFLALAATGGTILGAETVMILFWLGTLPAMLSLGSFARGITGALQTRVPRLTSALVLLAGVFSLSTHLGFIGLPFHTGAGHCESSSAMQPP